MPESKHRLRTIFLEAREIDDAAQRAAYLDDACGADADLRRRVEALMVADAEAGGFLGRSPEQDRTHPSDEARKPPVVPPPNPSSTRDQTGDRLGNYQLLQHIGEGGMGVVYMAEQETPVRRRVALKVIKLGLDTRQVIARFKAEAQALALMNHPNIARVFEVGATAAGRPFLVMELVRGIKITEYCDQQRLSTHQRLELFAQVCQAIQHAHQKGIIHRDIKPSNILVTRNDGVPVPKVIDFGIAKAIEQKLTDKTLFTEFQALIGTPAYMSPEQADLSSVDIDTRSDIYALGVLLYQLLTGQTPFDGQELLQSGLDEMRRTIREKTPPKPSRRLSTLHGEALTTLAQQRGTEAPRLIHLVRGDLDWIVMKCLEKDRTRRYETANSLALDVGRHLKNEPIIARPPTAIYQFQKLVQRNKAAAFAILSVLLALVTGLGIATTALVRERAARQREFRETLRADTVSSFVETLVHDAVPAMIHQGNVNGARQIINTVDTLASIVLSNAPAAEINLRLSLRHSASQWLFDRPTSLRLADAIRRLLPLVPDDQLTEPRDRIRVWLASSRLRGGQAEAGMKELDELYKEYMAYNPPKKVAALLCRWEQGIWYFHDAGMLDKAEEKFAEAYELFLPKAVFRWWRCAVLREYADVLVRRGKPEPAERIAAEILTVPPPFNDLALFAYYVPVLAQVSNALCAQGRHEEATVMLGEQRELVAAGGDFPRALVRIDALRGEVLARSAKAQAALPILEAVATNRLSEAREWHHACVLAVATDDTGAYRRLCQTGLLRFASSAEGHVAASVAWGLLNGSPDETMLSVARAMVDRVAHAQDWTIEFLDSLRAGVALHEQRYAEALALLDQFRDTPPPSFASGATHKDPGAKATLAFHRARLCAELGRLAEARQDYIRGLHNLKLARGNSPTHDRGWRWWTSYDAENAQRTADAVFKTKGIAISEPAFK